MNFPQPKPYYLTNFNSDHGKRVWIGFEQKQCEKCDKKGVYMCGLCKKHLCKNCHKWLA